MSLFLKDPQAYMGKIYYFLKQLDDYIETDDRSYLI